MRFESKPSAWAAEAVRIGAEEAARKAVAEKRKQLQQAQEAQEVSHVFPLTVHMFSHPGAIFPLLQDAHDLMCDLM